jgi:hypothetical protein
MDDLKPVEFDGDVILAYGEVTGHAHRIKKETAKLWSAGAERFLQTIVPTALTHEEHSTITLDSPWYKVVQQREYTPEAIRNVAD